MCISALSSNAFLVAGERSWGMDDKVSVFVALFNSIEEKSSSDEIADKTDAKLLLELCAVDENTCLGMRFTPETLTFGCLSAAEGVDGIEDVDMRPRVDFLAPMFRPVSFLNELVVAEIDILVDPFVDEVPTIRPDPFCTPCPRLANIISSPSLINPSIRANQFYNKIQYLTNKN